MDILHQTQTVRALLPRYVERFRCIGAQCEDTCCRAWNVGIDEKTFDAYRTSGHPGLRRQFAISVAKREEGGTSDDFARIALEPQTLQCPMTEEGLCSVQKNLGESYLSHTCFTFPRYPRQFGGQHEQSLSLSCPEAARQALLAPDAFDFIEAGMTVRMETVIQTPPAHGLSIEAMNEARILCLKLIRTDGLEIWQKLAVLGLFCERLTEVLDGGDAGALALVDETIALIEQGGIAAALAGMRPDYRSQATVFAMFWNGFAVNQAMDVSPVQARIVAAISRGLGADADTSEARHEQIVQAYAVGIQRLPEALAAAPFLLEHFVLNEMFRGMFPFRGKHPYDAFLQLISQFGLLRLMLAAQCTSPDALPSPQDMVHTVHVFYRRFQHDARFAQLNGALRRSGLGTLEKAYRFLRT